MSGNEDPALPKINKFKEFSTGDIVSEVTQSCPTEGATTSLYILMLWCNFIHTHITQSARLLKIMYTFAPHFLLLESNIG